MLGLADSCASVVALLSLSPPLEAKQSRAVKEDGEEVGGQVGRRAVAR